MRRSRRIYRAGIIALAILAGLASPARAGMRQDTVAAQAAYDAWRDCVMRSAVVFAKNATAPEAVDAALGVCSTHESRFRLALALWSTHGGWSRQMSMPQLNQHMALARRKMHEAGLAAAITGDPHPQPAPPLPPPPAPAKPAAATPSG